MSNDVLLKEKICSILPNLDERQARLYLASEAKILGRGGKQKIASLAKVSRVRIDKGMQELEEEVVKPNTDQPIRKKGGGRKSKKDEHVDLVSQIESIVSPHTRGDPMNPLIWTSKSLRQIEAALLERGFKVSYVTVGEVLKTLGYSLQANKKTDEGGKVEDRNEQFEFINSQSIEFMEADNPVISVDCKKKENVGNYKNNGVEWTEQYKPTEVKVYDFIDKELGKAIPYGVYDIYKNEGWVNVGISSDTAQFAVNSIRTWWNEMGMEQYKTSTKILITADGGGSNSTRGRLWKTELQKFATEIGMEINVCHFPPGTSKWNKIEHRLFSYISKNWRAKPLTSIEVIVNLISNTTTDKGLKVKAKKDSEIYQKSIKISDEELEKVNLFRNEFRGDWNYKILP